VQVVKPKGANSAQTEDGEVVNCTNPEFALWSCESLVVDESAPSEVLTLPIAINIAIGNAF